MDSGQPFHDPHVRLSKIYTRTGDEGKTSLVGGQRVSKDALRIEAYGTVDELNAAIGLAITSIPDGAPPVRLLAIRLMRVQHELFNLGSLLATESADIRPGQPVITASDVARLESEIDEANNTLQPLRSFILPGGCRLNAELHLCRTICRRAERRVVTLAAQETVPPEAVHYLNRLSDALFVWSRLASRLLDRPETLWQPNQP
ncbi:MAG: cob(I)yrinic acid a,c-diamide adenosyltransferase [Acidobacteria bacterium]|nr:cob(I)yrinic acid a,c-diamide adenosyltransferase [Acidobacteriota bacterium]